MRYKSGRPEFIQKNVLQLVFEEVTGRRTFWCYTFRSVLGAGHEAAVIYWAAGWPGRLRRGPSSKLCR